MHIIYATMAALAVLEDIVNGAIGRIAPFVRRAAAGVGAQHSEGPCAACATGDVHTGV